MVEHGEEDGGHSGQPQAGRADVQASLREEGRSGTVGVGRVRLRQLLVVSETALAIVLLVAAGLLLQSFRRLNAVDPGFRPEQVMTMSVSVPAFKYPDFAQVDAFHRDLRERVAAVPGVQTVGEVRTAPLAGSLPPNDVEVEGRDLKILRETDILAKIVK